jgi:hypothetical protein
VASGRLFSWLGPSGPSLTQYMIRDPDASALCLIARTKTTDVSRYPRQNPMGSEACLVATGIRAFSYSLAPRGRPFPWRPESLPRRRPMKAAPQREERGRELPRPSGFRVWAFCLRWAQSKNDSRRQARYRPQGSSRSLPRWMIRDAVKCPNAFQCSNATRNGLSPLLVACGSKLVQSLDRISLQRLIVPSKPFGVVGPV